MAAVVSCFTFQRRGPDSNEPMPPRRWPNQEVAQRQPGARRRSGATCTSPSATAGCPRPAGPIPGFTAAIYAWVQGDDLADVLEDEEMTGGDFVRNVKQTIDLLRQIADVVPDPATAADGPGRGRRVPAGRGRGVEHRQGARPRDQTGRGVGRPDVGRAPTSRSRAATPISRRRCRPPGRAGRVPARPDRPISPRAVGLDAGPSTPGRRARDRRSCALDDEPLAGAVNMIVIGHAAGRARAAGSGASARIVRDRRAAGRSTVRARPWSSRPGSSVRGLDLVPRGHPGDGRAEVQVYAVSGAANGASCAPAWPPAPTCPHPRITQRSGHRVAVSTDRRSPLEVDGRPDRPRIASTSTVVPTPTASSSDRPELPTGRKSSVTPTRANCWQAIGGDARRSSEPSLPSPVPCSTRRRRSPTTKRIASGRTSRTSTGRSSRSTNLPEVVKGALFARYSRSDKSLRRLFLDEFVGDLDLSGDLTVDATVGLKRAEQLYDRVFLEYGDDSVAQLGGVHLACEQASNLLTKILEWGRLMAYLEQSTRYIPYDSRLQGRYRYLRPSQVCESPIGTRYVADMDALFDTYSAALPAMMEWARERVPEGARRLRLRLQADDQGQGVRLGARRAARGDALERRHLRHRPGVRGAAAAHARPPAARGADVRAR